MTTDSEALLILGEILAGDEPDGPLVPWLAPAILQHAEGGAFTIEGGSVVLRLSGKRRNAEGKLETWGRRFRVRADDAAIEYRSGQATLLRRGKAVQAVDMPLFSGRKVRRFLRYLDDAASTALEQLDGEPPGRRRRGDDL